MSCLRFPPSWEYPGFQGIGCNEISPNDTANFLTFLQELRQEPAAKDILLTAATPISPWKDADGNPSADVSGFAKVLDFITVMNYDINGQWCVDSHIGRSLANSLTGPTSLPPTPH